MSDSELITFIESNSESEYFPNCKLNCQRPHLKATSFSHDSAWRGLFMNGDWSASPETTEFTNRKI